MICADQCPEFVVNKTSVSVFYRCLLNYIPLSVGRSNWGTSPPDSNVQDPPPRNGYNYYVTCYQGNTNVHERDEQHSYVLPK